MNIKPKKVRSENLTVVFTDIVGFAETTARQSREANASMLARHDKLLLPIAKKFGGRRVKSIGDALLLVFRSSTDALLCCMAMQDSLFENNRRSGSQAEIHIRTAVNVGEVRVVRGDVFGEAVNIAARLEDITPQDAIYLTNAVYMTMNRAEVPVEEVGLHRFKGVAEEIRVFQVPRFSATKLVVDQQAVNQEVGESREGFVYPYGGVHLIDYEAASPGDSKRSWRVPSLMAAVIVALLVLLLWFFWPRSEVSPGHGAGSSLRLPPGMPPESMHRPPPPPPPWVEPHYPREGSEEPLGGTHDGMQQQRMDILVEQVSPWLVDGRWFVSPVRLKDAPLPLANRLEDDEAGALPLSWSELPKVEQILYSSLQDSWDSLAPDFQRRLLNTGKVWRGALPTQRRAVLEEIKAWQAVAETDRGIARRRLDYLRGLGSDKRWRILDEQGLALSLSGGSEAGESANMDVTVPEGVEVRPPPPRNIWQRPPGQVRPAPSGDRSDTGYPRDGAPLSRPPPPKWEHRPPPPRGFEKYPPPPPREWGGRPPPPLWERDGGGRPPPERQGQAE